MNRCAERQAARGALRSRISVRHLRIVFLEPWKEKKISGNGYISHIASGCTNTRVGI